MRAHLAPPPPRMLPMFWSRFCGWAREWAVATSSSSSMEEEGDMVRRGASEEWRHPGLDTLYTAEMYSHTRENQDEFGETDHDSSSSSKLFCHHLATIISTVINQFKIEKYRSLSMKSAK